MNSLMDSLQVVKTLPTGVLICAIIAAAASCISDYYGAPAMLVALLLGMAFHFLVHNEKAEPGVAFSSRKLLRWGVALLGLRVTLTDLTSLGTALPLGILGLTILTIGGGVVLSRFVGRGARFGILGGGAVAICGASAALAISCALGDWKTKERDTLLTIAAVTSLSTIAMVLYPILFHYLDLSDTGIGILLGATIHDVAQVVGAGYSVSEEAGNAATITKLMRVSLLPIMVLAVTVVASRKGKTSESSNSFPWFAVVFLALLLLNSSGYLPSTLVDACVKLSGALLLMAISGLGIRTSLKSLLSVGRPYLVVVIADTVWLAALAVIFTTTGLIVPS